MSKKINCPFCNSDNFEIIIERKFPRHSICLNCGFVYQTPILDFESNKDFYSSEYWNEHHNIHGLKTEYEITNRQLRILHWFKEAKLSNQSCILEIGCGFGFNLDFLKKNLTNNVEGLEISIEGTENVRKAFEMNCFQSTLEEFVPQKQYEGVVLCHVLEHFENPSMALKKVHGLIKEEGLLWVEVPNIMSINPRKSLSSWLAKEHISYFSPAKFKSMIIASGFEIVKMESKHYNCILAKKTSYFDSNKSYYNEVWEVKFSLIKHRIKYLLYIKLKQFGIEIFNKINL